MGGNVTATRLISNAVRDPETGCWQWQGPLTWNGYAESRRFGRRLRVHRAVYEMERAPIPPGMQLDHLCRLRSCINPDHLEAVTARTNLLRGIGWGGRNAAKTHCPIGHALVGENVIHRKRLPHGRECRYCDRDRKRRSYHTGRVGKEG